MRTITAPSPVQRIELVVGDATAVLEVDVSPDNLLCITEASKKAMPLINAAQALDKKGKENQDPAMRRDANKGVARAVATVIRTAAGEEGYEAMLVAAGQGERISPERANGVALAVLSEVMACVRAQNDFLTDTATSMAETIAGDGGMTAVQYLAEVSHDRGEPVPEA